jgi:hypothetical protein
MAGAKTKSLVGALAGLLVVAGIGTALWAFVFRAPKPELARYVPKDFGLYVEAPSMPKLLVALAGVDVVDRKALDLDARRDEVAKAIADGLDVSEKDAKAFVNGVRALAAGARNADDKKKGKQSLVLVQFDGVGSVKPILASKHFETDGKLGSGAGKWKRADAKKKAKGDDDDDDDKKDEDAPKKLKGWAQRVDRMVAGMGDDNACALWEGPSLLGCGPADVLDDVDATVTGKSEGLAKSATFQKARWPSGTQVFVFTDPAFIDDEKTHDQYFDGVGPIAASLRFTSAGAVIGARVELKGEKVPATDLSPASPAKLSLAKRLPAGTIGYLAFSSRTKGKYEDFEKALFKAVENESESKAKELERNLDRMETEIGFTLKTLYQAIGDEGVVGVFSTKKVSIESFKSFENAVDDLGLVYLQHVKDKDKAKEIVESLRKKAKDLGALAGVKKLDDGFEIEPEKDGWPSATVRLDGSYLIVVVGRDKNQEEAKKAFKGDVDTLSKDKAHRKAMDALDGDNQIVLWVDAGRLGKSALDGDVRDELKKEGIPLEAIRLEGDDRITIGSAIRVSVEDKRWVVEMASLNGPDPLSLALIGFGARRRGL